MYEFVCMCECACVNWALIRRYFKVAKCQLKCATVNKGDTKLWMYACVRACVYVSVLWMIFAHWFILQFVLDFDLILFRHCDNFHVCVCVPWNCTLHTYGYSSSYTFIPILCTVCLFLETERFCHHRIHRWSRLFHSHFIYDSFDYLHHHNHNKHIQSAASKYRILSFEFKGDKFLSPSLFLKIETI